MATELRRIVVAVFAALFAIGVTIPVAAAAGPQERSPWPQFQHDPQRTGRTTVNGPVTLRQKWVYYTQRSIIGGLAIAEDGTIYAPSEHYLTAVRPDGERRWRVDVRAFEVNGESADGGAITAPAIDDDDNIIVGVRDGRILSIAHDDGDLDWAFEVSSSPYADGSSPVRGPALLDDEHCCILLGADEGNVFQVSYSGRDRGIRGANGEVTAAPARGPRGSIFWASHANELYNGHDYGGNRWKFGLDGTAYAGPAIGPDGTAYIGTGNGTLYAIDAEGVLRWKTVLSADTKLRAAPSLGANGTVYIGSENGTLYAVDGGTGTVKWEFATGGGIVAPALVDGRDSVYVASQDGKVYVLSPTGGLYSTFATRDEIVAAMALGADGTLYVGSRDRGLYALEEGDPTAAAAAVTATTSAVTVTVQRDFTTGRVYLVGAGRRHWVPDPTTAAILDIGPQTWTDVRPEQLTPIPEAPPVPALREGSLIRDPSGPIYVIRNARREWIPSPAAFAAGGYQWSAVINVPAFVVARIPAVLPEGTLVRESGGSRIYVIEGGRRHWISTLELFVSRGFQWNLVTEADGSFLRSIPEGLPFGIGEGSIVKGSGDKVYVIENGLRRWIPTPTTFFIRGYRWESLVILSDAALSTIQEGAPLPPS